MSRYLLDTNQLLHLADRPDLLTRAARDAFEHADAFFVPVVAAWEIEIKRRLTFGDGRPKLDVQGETTALVRYAVERGGTILNLDLKHVTGELETVCPNRDPFDQVLLQQAQVEELSLLTSDTQLRGHPLVMFVG